MDIYLESLEREREEEQKVQEIQIERTNLVSTRVEAYHCSRRSESDMHRVICAPIMQSENVNCS